MTEVERLRQQLRKLSLHTMAAIFEEEAEKAAKSQMSYTAFLVRLADEEVAAKTERSINAKVAKARFPAIKTLESFNFSFQPSLLLILSKN
ncbi:MAG: ATP-binding protein [Firmicutes bacterium]|nr:ATP-binding protein [Bacillota bacterium]